MDYDLISVRIRKRNWRRRIVRVEIETVLMLTSCTPIKLSFIAAINPVTR